MACSKKVILEEADIYQEFMCMAPYYLPNLCHYGRPRDDRRLGHDYPAEQRMKLSYDRCHHHD